MTNDLNFINFQKINPEDSGILGNHERSCRICYLYTIYCDTVIMLYSS